MIFHEEGRLTLESGVPILQTEGGPIDLNEVLSGLEGDHRVLCSVYEMVDHPDDWYQYDGTGGNHSIEWSRLEGKVCVVNITPVLDTPSIQGIRESVELIDALLNIFDSGHSPESTDTPNRGD